jgi:MFS family permease
MSSLFRARIAVAAIFFVNGFGFASWVSRIPAVRATLNLSDGVLGTALFASAIGALMAFPLAGRLTSSKNSRFATLVTGFAYFAVLPFPMFAPSLSLLAIALFAFGAANGAMDVSMNALGVETETALDKPIMSSLHAMWSAGGLSGAALGGLLANQNISPQVHLLGAAALVGATMLIAKFWALQPAPAPVSQSTPHFARPEATLMGLGAMVFCAFLIEGAMADWSALLLRDAYGATEGIAALGYAAFSVAMMSMRFAGDRLITRWGAVRVLRSTNIVAALALAAVLWHSDIALVMTAFALVGLAMATVAPLVFRAAAQRARSGPGQGIAAMATMGYGGFLAGPPIVGWIAQATSLRTALALLVVLGAIIAMLAHHLRRSQSE